MQLAKESFPVQSFPWLIRFIRRCVATETAL